MTANAQGYTYDIFPALHRLKTERHSLDADTAARLKLQVAINAMDPQAVNLYADLSGDDWAHLYPPAAPVKTPDTEQAIDIFLNQYGGGDSAETDTLEKLIFNPTPDYASVLEAGEEQPAAENDAELMDTLIADFLPQEPPTAETPAFVEAPVIEEKGPEKPVSVPGSSLAESLAKSYIRQGRYERAYEIISQLSLNNPEKSVYFADQLRFLRKLIEIGQARSGQGPK